MAASTVPAVKAKLVSLFSAAVEAETQVWVSRTNEEHRFDENVYVGDVRGRRQFRTFMGGSPGSREENYTIMVELEVFRDGTDLEGTETRMWELAQALELAIASRPTLEGLTNVSWAISEEFQQKTSATTGSVLAKYMFGVAITARI